MNNLKALASVYESIEQDKLLSGLNLIKDLCEPHSNWVCLAYCKEMLKKLGFNLKATSIKFEEFEFDNLDVYVDKSFDAKQRFYYVVTQSENTRQAVISTDYSSVSKMLKLIDNDNESMLLLVIHKSSKQYMHRSGIVKPSSFSLNDSSDVHKIAVKSFRFAVLNAKKQFQGVYKKYTPFSLKPPVTYTEASLKYYNVWVSDKCYTEFDFCNAIINEPHTLSYKRGVCTIDFFSNGNAVNGDAVTIKISHDAYAYIKFKTQQKNEKEKAL